ncbi:hypothetical protein A0H81_14599 [Grifola frondosa]|uniref:Uncharacterized protein n=1 Tax=Grifola frondosa TaxID=5627 RepID=A0A1C7LL39_GRIFR|nr:hypothetical protein A0H81_14599 [Grifola frondosa]
MTKDNADASMSTLVGLGISGMLKDDGTFFDGLGALPRRSQIDPPGLGLFLSENDGHWAWTHEVPEDMDDTRPGHIWQTDITFARRFDAQLRTMPGTSTPGPRVQPHQSAIVSHACQCTTTSSCHFPCPAPRCLRQAALRSSR